MSTYQIQDDSKRFLAGAFYFVIACLTVIAVTMGILVVVHQSDLIRANSYRHCTEVVIDSAKCVAP